MIGLRINQAKSMFLDRPKVMSAVDRATLKVFRRFGAFVMTTARRSIRRPGKKASTKTSRPGEPPRSRTGLLKKFIFFCYDPAERSVVIGPAKLNSGSDAPEILEYSGQTTIRTRTLGKWRTVNGKHTRFSNKREKKRISIEERPYMGPAFDKEIKGLDSLWRDSVK